MVIICFISTHFSFSCLLGFSNKNPTSYTAFVRCWLSGVCNVVFLKNTYNYLLFSYTGLWKRPFYPPKEPLLVNNGASFTDQRASFARRRCVFPQKTTFWLIKRQLGQLKLYFNACWKHNFGNSTSTLYSFYNSLVETIQERCRNLVEPNQLWWAGSWAGSWACRKSRRV